MSLRYRTYYMCFFFGSGGGGLKRYIHWSGRSWWCYFFFLLCLYNLCLGYYVDWIPCTFLKDWYTISKLCIISYFSHFRCNYSIIYSRWKKTTDFFLFFQLGVNILSGAELGGARGFIQTPVSENYTAYIRYFFLLFLYSKVESL